MSDSGAEIDRLAAAVRRRFGALARVENPVVPSLGGSNRTILFDLVEGAGRRRLVSRQSTYQGEGDPFLPAEQQFALMQVVHAHGVPAPAPVFAYEAADGMGTGFVTAFVAGETMPKRILGDAAFAGIRPELPAALGRLLARLHAIDPEEARFLEPVPDSVDPLIAQRDHYDAYDEPHPALDLGFRWLDRHRPAGSRRTIVHGDFRLGNLMVGDTGIAALLDWECSHLGAPEADLGWLCCRPWRFGQSDRPVGGLSARQPLYAAYEAEAGVRLDHDAIRYWEIFGLVRWAVINMMQAFGHVRGGRRSVAFAACGRNAALIEYDLLMSLGGQYD